MNADLIERTCADIIVELGLDDRDDLIEVRPLTGGVASDIFQVETRRNTYCVKFAIEKLRVEADWFAPLHRNAAEYEWLYRVGQWFPENVPRLFGRSDAKNGFVMEFIKGRSVRQWKTDLLRLGPRLGDAEAVGRLLGGIHAASAQMSTERDVFQNQSDFYDLRIEPYLVSLASKHPSLTQFIDDTIQSLSKHQTVLIHGDVSPKNILFRSGEPIILDAECATIGDPCFDIAFCLNHLLLKAVHLKEHRASLLREASALWAAYNEKIDWEMPSSLEARVCALLPLLMLARVDGKSPVEYLSTQNRVLVRDLSLHAIGARPQSFHGLFQAWEPVLT